MYDDLMEMIDREADGSDSLEVSEALSQDGPSRSSRKGRNSSGEMLTVSGRMLFTGRHATTSLLTSSFLTVPHLDCGLCRAC